MTMPGSRRQLRYTLLALLLLAVIVANTVWGLGGLVRGLKTDWLLLVGLAGLGLSWALARSRLPGKLAWPILLLGLGGVAWRLSATAQPATWAALAALLARTANWLKELAGGAGRYDPAAVNLVWSSLVWLSACWAAWAVQRSRQPLLGVTPVGLLLAGALNYAQGDILVLLPLLGASLLLLALIRYAGQEHTWETNRVDYAEDIRFDLTLTVGGLVLALLMTAVASPPLSIPGLARFVQALADPVVWTGNEALGVQVQQGAPGAFASWGGPAAELPRQHLLGAGPELRQTPVLRIYTVAQPSGQTAPLYYWRGLTYDTYSGQGWYNRTPLQTTRYAARQNSASLTVSLPALQTLHQEVEVLGNTGGLLYASGFVVQVDQPYAVAWRQKPKPAGDSAAQLGDAFAGQTSASYYQVETRLPAYTLAELRAASGSYPREIRGRYLGLPESVPERVLALAHDLTAAAPTPYDQAEALVAYLRTYSYTLDIPAPPSDRDVVDYFLFDLRQGYCDYYATSMVVLARAAGLPARLVIGYVGGEYQPATGSYLVREAQAHSWVEVYFNGLGWVTFEPTAAYPAQTPAAAQQIADRPSPSPLRLPGWLRPAGWLGWLGTGLGGAALLAALGWLMAEALGPALLPPDKAIGWLYRRAGRLGRRLTGPLPTGATPHEASAALAAYLATPAPLLRLTELYTQTIYSAHPATRADQRQAIRLWRRLWWALLFTRKNTPSHSTNSGGQVV